MFYRNLRKSASSADRGFSEEEPWKHFVWKVIVEDGQMLITGLPYKRGQRVEVIMLPYPPKALPRQCLTVGQLRRSGLIGLWQDHDDIEDGSAHARQLREKAQQRGDIHHDFAR